MFDSSLFPQRHECSFRKAKSDLGNIMEERIVLKSSSKCILPVWETSLLPTSFLDDIQVIFEIIMMNETCETHDEWNSWIPMLLFQVSIKRSTFE